MRMLTDELRMCNSIEVKHDYAFDCYGRLRTNDISGSKMVHFVLTRITLVQTQSLNIYWMYCHGMLVQPLMAPA